MHRDEALHASNRDTALVAQPYGTPVLFLRIVQLHTVTNVVVCGLPRELFLVNCRQPVRMHAVSDEPLAAADCAREAMCQGNPQESV